MVNYGNGARLLDPSGDTSGTTDSAAIGAASGHAILGPGEWYIGAPGLTTSQSGSRAAGPATIINVVSGGTGFTVVGPGQLYVSDMAIAVGSGAYAFTVNGAYDAHFWNLYISGASAAGGIKINGDDSLEQHWTDVVIKNCGGVDFDYERTTSIYTGSLYLDRVRIVTPPAGAKGFKFNSTAGSASLNTVFMTQCVADAFLEDAYEANNVAQTFITDSWFAVGSGAAGGSVPMRITGGFQHTYLGCYTYTGLTSGTDVIVTGAPNGVYLGGGHVFDGSAGNIAISVSGITTPGGFTLGDYLNYCGTLSDSARALSVARAPSALPSGPSMLPLFGGGEAAFNPGLASQNGISAATGVMLLAFGYATVTETIDHISVATGGTSATSATYCAYGLFTVDASYNLTLVAHTASNTSLWTTNFQSYNGINVTQALSASYTKIAGQLYAVGMLYVGTGTAPTVVGASLFAGDGGSALAAGMGAKVTGLSTVPSSVAVGSLVGFSNPPCFALLP